MGHRRQWISRATDRPKVAVTVVGLGGTYYNPKRQVDARENRPPEATRSHHTSPTAHRPTQTGRARQLDTDHIQELIAGYQAGATVYELGARFGIERRATDRRYKPGVTLSPMSGPEHTHLPMSEC